MKNHAFQGRINYGGDLRPILSKVCEDYGIGKYKVHNVVLVGYEDFNLILTTNKGKFFVKVFAAFRKPKDCQRYIEVVQRVLGAGVTHPQLYKSSQGVLYKANGLRLCVSEFIDGKSFYELDVKPIRREAQVLIQQAARINNLKMRPSKVYDTWGIVNFLREYRDKKKYISEGDVELIEPLVKSFVALGIRSLPHRLVHGDIISTNVMRDKQGKLHVIDFSVANYYPRINELAVLLCDLLFDPQSPTRSRALYDFALAEYQKYIPFTSKEISALPLYIRMGHAMHIIGASAAIAKNGPSQENQYWLNLGRAGLEQHLV